MKRKYLAPSVACILLDEIDILTASGDDLDELYPNEAEDGHTKRY